MRTVIKVPIYFIIDSPDGIDRKSMLETVKAKTIRRWFEDIVFDVNSDYVNRSAKTLGYSLKISALSEEELNKKIGVNHD
jgi:hypothetical protein